MQLRISSREPAEPMQKRPSMSCTSSIEMTLAVIRFTLVVAAATEYHYGN